MINRTARTLAVACGIAATLVPATESQACCFSWLFGGCGRTTYRPLWGGHCAPACPPTCAPACPPQTCNYVPQTCYRTECVNVPVTTYQPACTVDPCTGCPVTTMRPVTSYVRQVRRVPFTTYRPVVTAAPACCPTTTTASYAAPAACPTCPVPAVTTPAPSAMYSAPATTIPQTTVPALTSPESTTVVPQTYQQNSASGPDLLQRRIPDEAADEEDDAPRSTRSPRYEPRNLTASMPLQTARPYTAAYTGEPARETIVPAQHLVPIRKSVDDSGWHSAAR